MDNKQRAVQFLKLLTERKIDEAYTTYVDMSGKHHNAHTPAGFVAYKKGTRAAHTMFPNTKITVKHVLEDGDMVAVHSHVVLKPKERGLAVVHLMRFKKNKIIEIWDCAQAIPAKSPNTDGMF